MKPKYVVIMFCVFLVLYFGKDVLEDWLQMKRDSRFAEITAQEKRDLLKHVQFVDSQKTEERMKIMAELSQRDKFIQEMFQQSEEYYEATLKSVTGADRAEMQGIKITRLRLLHCQRVLPC